MNLAGKFVVVDGPDGSGKGTQLERLAAWIQSVGVECVQTRDPGGTPYSDMIRRILLDYDLSMMDPTCETLLFMASRAQLVAEVVRPAIETGQAVLCDRFISATCAYQVAAGYPRERVLELGQYAVGATWPDLTIVLDVPAETGFERIGRKPHHSTKRRRSPEAGQSSLFDGAAVDAMERRPLDFHRRVRELFRELPGVYPAPVVLIDATRDVETVAQEVREAVARAFE